MPESNPKKEIHYVIQVEEHLAACWAAWFEGFSLRSLENGGTLLIGVVLDQAALHGLLARVRDLNLTLVALKRISPGQSEA